MRLSAPAQTQPRTEPRRLSARGQEILDLFRRLARVPEADRDAIVQEIWRKNRSLVARIAQPYIRKDQGRHFDGDDLIAEGQLGLAQAIAEFDPARGVAFSHFAAFYVRRAILRFIRVAGHALYIPEHAYYAARNATGRAGGKAVNPEQIAAARRVLAGRILVPDELLHRPILEPTPADLAAERDEIAWLVVQTNRLPQSQRFVIQRLLGLDGAPPQSLLEIAQSRGCSWQRCQQLRNLALARLAACFARSQRKEAQLCD